MATGLLMDAFPETPMPGSRTFQYSRHPRFDNVRTWPPKRTPRPLFKPLFDEHWTPVSKFPKKQDPPSQLLVREVSPSMDSDSNSTPEQATPTRHTSSRSLPLSATLLTPTKSRASNHTTPCSPKSPVAPEEFSPRSCLFPTETSIDVLVSERINSQRGISPRAPSESSISRKQQSFQLSSAVHQRSFEKEQDDF